MITVPVTLLGRTVTSRTPRGNDVLTDAPVATDGIFAPGGSSEDTNAQDTVVTKPTLYLRDMDLTSIDGAIVNGEPFEVDGDPKRWPANPFDGWEPEFPLEVTLRRVTG